MKNCGAQNCKDLTCQDRHPQVCRFFQRQKCRFSENCAFKHEQKGEEHDVKVCNDKVSKSINLIKDLENIVESLKKELETKNLIVSAKEAAIKEKDVKIKDMEKKIKNLNSITTKLNVQIKEKEDKLATFESDLATQSESQTQCKECGKMFTTSFELKDHEVEHTYTVMVLRSVVTNLIDEKAKHKKICDFAWYCPHKNDCNADCYFINKEFVEVESDMEDMFDEEIENVNNDEDKEDNIDEDIVENYTEIDKLSNNKENECEMCSFAARNKGGLKMHMKSEHIVPCKKCNYKTTTSALLNKHKKTSHK